MVLRLLDRRRLGSSFSSKIIPRKEKEKEKEITKEGERRAREIGRDTQALGPVAALEADRGGI